MSFFSCRREAICLHLNALERIRINPLQQTSSSRSGCTAGSAVASHSCRRLGRENTSQAGHGPALSSKLLRTGWGWRQQALQVGWEVHTQPLLDVPGTPIQHGDKQGGEASCLTPAKLTRADLFMPWILGSSSAIQQRSGIMARSPQHTSLALECDLELSYLLANPGALFQVSTSWSVPLQVVIKS